MLISYTSLVFGRTAIVNLRLSAHRYRCYSLLRSARSSITPATGKYCNNSILTLCRHGSSSPTEKAAAACENVTGSHFMSPREQWAVDAATTQSTSSQEELAADAAALLEKTEGLAAETLADVGLGGFSPVGLVQHFLELVHTTTGLPWWMTIVLGTITLRTVMIPLSVYGRKKVRKLYKIENEVEDIRKMKKMYTVGRSGDRASMQIQRLHMVYQKAGVRPMAANVPYIGQFLFILTNYFAITRMARAPIFGMLTEGALTFPDLTSPSWVLHLVNIAAQVAAFRLGDGGILPPHMARMKWFMTFSIIPFMALFGSTPSAFILFWFTNSSYSICYSVIMKIIDRMRGYPMIHVPARNPVAFVRKVYEERKVESSVRDILKPLKKEIKLYKQYTKDKKPKLYKRNPVVASS